MYYSPQDLQNSPELVKLNYIFIKNQKYIIPEGKIWIMKLKIFHLKLSKNMTNVNNVVKVCLSEEEKQAYLDKIVVKNQKEKHLKGRPKSKYNELYYENDLVMNTVNDYRKVKALGNNKEGYIQDKES